MATTEAPSKAKTIGLDDIKPGMWLKVLSTHGNSGLGVISPAIGDVIVAGIRHGPQQLCQSAKTTKLCGVHDFAMIFQVLSPEEILVAKTELIAALKKNIHIADRGYGQLLKVGSDPEIFAVNAKDEIIPAFEYLDKESSKQEFNGVAGTGRAFWDGFQAEFNIQPTHCHEVFTGSVRKGLEFVLRSAQVKDPKAKLTYKSVLEIPEPMLTKGAWEHVALGCAPSANAYEDEVAITVADPRSLSLRFAGCHIHYGFGKLPQETVIRRVKTIDRVFGPIMTLLLQGLEDNRRRMFYGKAGEYRLPPHGIEYRVPSSTLLCHPIVMNLGLDMCRFAAHLDTLGIDNIWVSKGDEQARDILNNYNLDEAKRVLKDNNWVLDAMLSGCYNVYGDLKIMAKAKAMILEGAKEHVIYDDLDKTWCLTNVAKNSYGDPIYTPSYVNKILVK